MRRRRRYPSFIEYVRRQVLPGVDVQHRLIVLDWVRRGTVGFRQWLLKADPQTIGRWANRQRNEPHGQFCEPEVCKGCQREWAMRHMAYLGEYWCDICQDEYYNPPETMKTEPVLNLPWSS